MKKISVSAFAKINLSLDVCGSRPDGYHEMRTVMQSVSLCDDVTIELDDTGVFRAESNLAFLPSDGQNIAARAAELFFRRTGDSRTGALIRMQKRIPVCAGLGGGSSDAAAVLRGLSRLTGAGLTPDELREMGGALGSDVPFCISGGTALGTGRGEVLADTAPLPGCHILIYKPEFSVSTPVLFVRLDQTQIRSRPDTEGLLSALEAGSLRGAAKKLSNIFEEVLPRRQETIRAIKNRMIENGALGAAMSGTGSAVFGLFDQEKAARRAARAFKGGAAICTPLRKLTF